MLGLTLGALTAWPLWAIKPAPDLDPSWHVALHLAHRANLAWGQEVLFSYGPLAIMAVPGVLTNASLLLGLFYGALCVSLIVAVPFYGLRNLRLWVALSFTVAICVFAPTDLFVAELISAGAFAVALFLFERRSSRLLTSVSAGFGVLLAIQMLVKPPAAVVVLVAIVVLALAGAPGKLGRVVAALVAFVVSTIVIWLALDQSLGDFPHWVRGSIQVALGYTEAMALEEPGRGREYVEAVALLLVLGLFIRRSASFATRRSAWIVCVSLSIVVWIAFKEGFVRHDLHSSVFFFTVALLATAIPRRRKPVWPLIAVITAGLVFTANAASPPGTAVLASAESFRTLVHAIVSPSYRAELTEEGRLDIREFDGVPDDVVAAVVGHPAHVDPTAVSAAWAYGLDWRPIPVFQRYSSYTEYLDELGAAMLRGSRAPDRILRKVGPGIDGRNSLWDSPRTMLEVVCRYQEGPASAGWGAFFRESSRCGKERSLGRFTFSAGETIRVPPAPDGSSLVVARFDFSVPLLQRVVSTVARPLEHLTIAADGRSFRVARPDVAGPLLVRATPRLAYGDGFGGDVAYRRLRPSLGGSVTFAAIPITRDATVSEAPSK